MIEAIKMNWYHESELPEIILPVPLSTSRLRGRGFNQAIELAKPIANAFDDISLDFNACRRIIKTIAQHTLGIKERKKNVKNAFSVSPFVKDRYVVILDDVVTTTHTVSSLGLACKKAGAARVDVWCVARTGIGAGAAPRTK